MTDELTPFDVVMEASERAIEQVNQRLNDEHEAQFCYAQWYRNLYLPAFKSWSQLARWFIGDFVNCYKQ
jgi:hypothetical protein